MKRGRDGLLAIVAAVACLTPRSLEANDSSSVSYDQLVSHVRYLDESNVQPSTEVEQCLDRLPDCNVYCCDPAYVYGMYEHVIVRPHFSRNAAFFRDDRVGSTDIFEEIPFDWDLEYSPRIEIGYGNPCCVGVRTRFWYFDHDSLATAAAGPGGGDFNTGFSGSNNDAAVFMDDVTSITAEHSIKLNVWDLELTRQRGGALYSAGLRYALVEQDYLAFEGQGVFDPLNPGPAIRSQHDFEGFGLTVGAEFLRPVVRRFSFFTKLRGSLLFGDSGFLAQDVDGDNIIIRSNDEDLIGVGEIQLGIDWRTRLSSGVIFFTTAAAEAQYWTNAGTALPGRVGEDSNDLDSYPGDADLGFFGFSSGVGLIY